MIKLTLPRVFVNALDKLSAESERYFGDAETVIEPLALAGARQGHTLLATLRPPPPGGVMSRQCRMTNESSGSV